MLKLENQIDEIISNEPKNINFEISQEISKYIQIYRKNLNSIFQESSGKGKNFLVRHTRFYDAIISLIYKTVLRLMFKNYSPNRSSIPILIVALGSYGREEMTIHSDIDLMIVFDEVDGFNISKIIETFIYIAWDAGLKLGHRVHNISEIVEVAETEHTIKTAMLEARKLIGSPNLFSMLQNNLNQVRENNREKFIRQKFEEAKIRYSKNSRGLMEVDIKEGFGGLRDANMLFWILNSIYGIANLKELVGKLFSEDEFKKFYSALDFLFQVRTAFHLSTKRKKDKIVLEDIPNIASNLNLNSHTQLSQKLLQSLSIIHGFSIKYIRKAVKPHLAQKPISKIYRVFPKGYIIDNRFEVSSNLKFENGDSFLKFLHSIPDTNLEIGSTIYSLLDNVKITELNQDLVLSLFSRKNLYPILDILYRTTTIDKIFQPFEKVMFLPQFDGYHKHPVDIHSIYNIRELENIEDTDLQKIYNSLSKEDTRILKIASLFHDIGKGRIDEHSKVGAKVIRSFLKKFQVADEVVETVATLIRYHTLMTTLAYHEDIYNERIIFNFTSKIKNERTLKLLYLITYADVRSVNSSSFNSYSKNLLASLYRSALSSFGNSEMLKESEKREKKENQIKNSEEFKLLPRSLQKAVLSIKTNLAFFKLSTSAIIELTKQAKNIENFSYKIENGSFLSIKIMRAGKVNFDIAYFLNRVNFLSVVSLDIFELFDGVKYFQIDFSEKVSEGDEYFIDTIIENSFLKVRKKFLKINPVIKREEIHIDCEYSNSYLKMSIHTANQNGLLAYLFKLFEDEKIDVVSSKTQTFKRKVKDTFLFSRQSQSCEKYYKLIEMMI